MAITTSLNSENTIRFFPYFSCYCHCLFWEVQAAHWQQLRNEATCACLDSPAAAWEVQERERKSELALNGGLGDWQCKN